MRTDARERHGVGRRSWAVWSIATLLVVAPAVLTQPDPLRSPLTTGPPSGPRTGSTDLLVRPIPFVPLAVRPIGIAVPAVVDPTGHYQSEPAPMGIADFGVGAEGAPYTYGTSEFLGNFSWNSLAISYEGDSDFSDQLNVVLQFTDAGATYAYWVQDVAFMDSATGELTFENNIWNFSSSSYCLSNSALSGNGTVYAYQGCEGYYAVDAFSQPGAEEYMPSPGDFSLLVRSYTSAGGVPEVAFEYWDGVTSYEVTYDNVVWPWATDVSTDNNFYVDGNVTAPSGNFYDAELSLGGPGGGSATEAADRTDASSRLMYWNGHNFEAPRSVWNFGGDTAEAISNVQSIFSHDAGGTPMTTQLNGTAQNATPARAYDQSRVGILAISAPGAASGTVSVNGSTAEFVSDDATLTLVPGEYSVWVNSTSGENDLGVCYVTADETTSVSVSGGCNPLVSTPTATPESVDVGQTVSFGTVLVAAGSGGDTYAWSVTGLGCSATTGATVSCEPPASGTYDVSVTVTDSDGRSDTSGTLQFTVDPDVSVGAPVGEPATAESGAKVTFSADASGGSGSYAYDWAGLPTPCSGTSGANPVCYPSVPGAYSVTVTVTDSNGYAAESAPLQYTVQPGPELKVPTSTPVGPVDLGTSVTFSTTESDGEAPFTYVWHGLPTGCVSENSTSVGCVASSPGTWSITVSVTDSAGGASTSGSMAFIVNAALEIGSLTPSSPAVDLGQNVTFLAVHVTGGDGVYTYSWSGLPPGCSGLNASSVSCTPSQSGAFTPGVVVADSDGSHVNSSVGFEVYTDPSIEGILVSRSSADVGQVVSFAAQGVGGGTGRYDFLWSGLPTGCASNNSPTLTCVPSDAGNSLVTVTVTDTDNASGSASIHYATYRLPTVIIAESAAPTLTVGKSSVLSAEVNGGSGGFRYLWLGLPTGCVTANSTTLTCTPSATGTYSVTVHVEDSNGVAAASAPASLIVVPAAAPSLFGGSYGLAVAGVLIVMAIAAAAVWAARRGRKTPPRGPG